MKWAKQEKRCTNLIEQFSSSDNDLIRILAKKLGQFQKPKLPSGRAIIFHVFPIFRPKWVHLSCEIFYLILRV